MTSLAQLQTACRLAEETLNLNEGEIDCTLGPWPTMVEIDFTTKSFVRYDDLYSYRKTTTEHMLTIYVDDAPSTTVLSDRIAQRISEVRPSEQGKDEMIKAELTKLASAESNRTDEPTYQFIVFGGEDFYPDGGGHDMKFAANDLSTAKAVASERTLRDEWVHILDLQFDPPRVHVVKRGKSDAKSHYPELDLSRAEKQGGE